MEDEDSPSSEQRFTRIRAGCESCRRRHLKCDERQASCLQCELLSVKCVRKERFRFRHLTRSEQDDDFPNQREFDFPEEQEWLAMPSTLVFVEDQGDFELIETGVNDCELGSIANIELSSGSGEEDTTIEWDEYNVSEFLAGPPSVLYNSTFSLTTAEEASLFRHFLDVLGPWFDMNDNEKTFTRELVRKAHVSPILLNAVLALSSRHLATISSFDSKKADQYSEKCVGEMICCLASRVDSMNDELFAATIILRTKEEMDAYPHGSDNQAHLLGIKAFTHSDWFESPPSTLRECTYWSALRQEINFALVRQCPLDINLHVNFVRSSSFDLSNEQDWSNYCMLNLAKIIRFCFDDRQRSKSRYKALYNEFVKLCDALPTTFHPFFYAVSGTAENVSSIPQIWLASEAAVFSLQYLTISRILFLCFDPTVPVVGPARKTAVEIIDKLIIKHLQSMCGIALSHHKYGPAMILASLGISLCGDRVVAVDEREKLLEILEQTQAEHAIPTSNIRKGLLRAWGAVD